MADKTSRDPQQIDAHTWYYEYPSRIEIIYSIWQNGAYLRTDSIMIPRRKLEASLRRMNGSRRKRA